MKIKLVTDVIVGGKPTKHGTVVDLDKSEAKMLINYRQAVEYIEEIEDVDLSGMKKDDLIAYAEELGIDVPSGATKDEIIKLIAEEE